jgi:hypothetical protein
MAWRRRDQNLEIAMQIVELLDRLQDAVAPIPGRRPGTDSIRTIALRLESMARTPDEKDAVCRLKNAIPDGDLQVIGSYVRSVFLRGVIGVDGWPLK